MAESIYLALRAERHNVFFDRADLPPGEEYHNRIRQAIERAQLFVFLVSPDAVDAGSYTLTELAIAQKTWDYPAGRLLPVVLHPIALDSVPPYLKSVTFLEPDGNVVAAVADAVHRIALVRRRAALKIFAIGLAATAVVGAGAYLYWTNRETAQEATGKDGAPAMLIPAGTFTMGDDEDSPLREVYLDAFYLDKYEVTTSRFEKFLQATGSLRPPDYWDEVADSSGALPVVGVDWRDADAYCRWADKRLPTEAQWEKAARGTDARIYPWGNDDPTPARANFGNASSDPYKGGLAAVGVHAVGKSPYAVDDLAGNVAEWVEDWFAEGYALGDVRNPSGPDTGTGKVIRGGGWHEPGGRLMSTKRFHASPDTRADDIGFRCARDARAP